MRRNIVYIVILLVVVVVLYFFVGPIPKANTQQKCPDDYGTDDIGSAEYLADFDKWTNDFYDNNPSASISDWSKARYDFWVKNGCTAAIVRYNEAKAGKADPETMEIIDDSIQKAINR